MQELKFPKDKKLQSIYERVIEQFGELPVIQSIAQENYFSQMAENIMGQQLSTKVADVIIARVKNLMPNQILDPEYIIAFDNEVLRAAGLSNAKVAYIKNLSLFWKEHKKEIEQIPNLSDEEIIKLLTEIKGVGRWTVEMFLIFSLGRPDVFSPGDLIIRNKIIEIYKLDPKVKADKLISISKKWSPHRSLACRILWKSLNLKT